MSIKSDIRVCRNNWDLAVMLQKAIHRYGLEGRKARELWEAVKERSQTFKSKGV